MNFSPQVVKELVRRPKKHLTRFQGRWRDTRASTDLRDLGELYHDFRIFNPKVKQVRGRHSANQQSKGPIIQSYICLAIAKSRVRPDDAVSFAELFCADGYYAMIARYFGASISYGIDNDRDRHFELADRIVRRLGLTDVHFIRGDVHDMASFRRTDIVANVGGLYHVTDPAWVLEQSYQMAKKFLIVQAVYSLANESDDYFETPAPNWNWGCRFSHGWLHKRIVSLGGKILDSHKNILEGNTRPEDRGSAYYLIEKIGA